MSLDSVEASIGPPDNLGTKASCSSQGPKVIHVCRAITSWILLCAENLKIKVMKLFLYVVYWIYKLLCALVLGEIHQGRQYHGYSKTTRNHRHQSPEFCVPKQPHQRWHSSRTSRGVKSSTRDDRSPSSSYYYPGQPYPIRSSLPPGEYQYLSPELFKPLTPSSNWKPNSPYWQRGCSPTNGGVVVSTRTNHVCLPTSPHCW